MYACLTMMSGICPLAKDGLLGRRLCQFGMQERGKGTLNAGTYICMAFSMACDIQILSWHYSIQICTDHQHATV